MFQCLKLYFLILIPDPDFLQLLSTNPEYLHHLILILTPGFQFQCFKVSVFQCFRLDFLPLIPDSDFLQLLSASQVLEFHRRRLLHFLILGFEDFLGANLASLDRLHCCLCFEEFVMYLPVHCFLEATKVYFRECLRGLGLVFIMKSLPVHQVLDLHHRESLVDRSVILRFDSIQIVSQILQVL